MDVLLTGRWANDEEREGWADALRHAAEVAGLPLTWWVDRGDPPPTWPDRVEVAVVANPPPGRLQGLPKLRLIQSLWAGVSGLLGDPNRPEDSDTLFRTMAEGLPVELNAALSDADRRLRLTDYYRPYHAALDATLGASLAPMLFAVHSFTPMYEGQPRAMELGVLFNREPALGYALTEHLSRAGYVTHANEPWSGPEGFMYSPDAHALRHGRRALELEVRQDLCTDTAYRARLIRVLTDFFARV